MAIPNAAPTTGRLCASFAALCLQHCVYKLLSQRAGSRHCPLRLPWRLVGGGARAVSNSSQDLTRCRSAGPQPSRLCWHHVARCLRFRARFGLQTRVPSGRGLGPKPGSSTAWRATSRGGPWTPGTRDTHGAPVEFGRVARGKLLSQACDDRLGFSGGPWCPAARSGRVVPHCALARVRGCSARACATRTAAQEAEARARQPPSARAGLQADACERSLG